MGADGRARGMGQSVTRRGSRRSVGRAGRAGDGAGNASRDENAVLDLVAVFDGDRAFTHAGSRTDSPASSGHASRSSITTPTSSNVSHSKAIDHLSHRPVWASRCPDFDARGRPTSVQAPSHTPIPSLSVSSAQSPPAVSASSNPFRRSTALTSPFSRTRPPAQAPLPHPRHHRVPRYR